MHVRIADPSLDPWPIASAARCRGLGQAPSARRPARYRLWLISPGSKSVPVLWWSLAYCCRTTNRMGEPLTNGLATSAPTLQRLEFLAGRFARRRIAAGQSRPEHVELPQQPWAIGISRTEIRNQIDDRRAQRLRWIDRRSFQRSLGACRNAGREHPGKTACHGDGSRKPSEQVLVKPHRAASQRWRFFTLYSYHCCSFSDQALASV